MRVTEETRQRIEAALPKSETTRAKLLAYKERGDLTWEQIGFLCGRGCTGLTRFASDKYDQTAESDVLIRRDLEQMFERYPLAITQAAKGPIYDTENAALLRKWFDYVHTSRAMVVLYGPPGSQKTFVSKRLVLDFNAVHLKLDDAERAFYVRSSVRMRPRDLLRRICLATGAPAGQTVLSCINGLRLAHSQQNVLLCVDEAQLLTLDALEALREVHDKESGINFGVLLMGSHQLARILDQKAPELEQLNSRIDERIELSGISFESAAEIIKAERPEFSLNKIRAMVEASRVPDIFRDGKAYINVRRLFKTLHSTRAAQPQKGLVQ